ncbi:universal stress protein [Methanoregula sp.]|uniref:universal stress protein n=1 Tax=Methanoregula sp. TaxID=2052170 RepID=UPI0035672DD9
MAEKLFENILVATDGSERNTTAVQEAVRIAAGSGAVLHAVYVVDTATYETASADVVMGDTFRVIQAEAEDALAKVRSLAGNIEVKTRVLEGKPAKEIVHFAATEKIDLIVIGTQGKKGIERLLLGSVAETVIRLAACRVLVVK